MTLLSVKSPYNDFKVIPLLLCDLVRKALMIPVLSALMGSN